jgi:hypothetical protein
MHAYAQSFIYTLHSIQKASFQSHKFLVKVLMFLNSGFHVAFSDNDHKLAILPLRFPPPSKQFYYAVYKPISLQVLHHKHFCETFYLHCKVVLQCHCCGVHAR